MHLNLEPTSAEIILKFLFKYRKGSTSAGMAVAFSLILSPILGGQLSPKYPYKEISHQK
jgi:H+/gluconate symporter-like permease